MSLYYLSFGSYWRNLSSPLTHWHRGTAFQVDTVKYHPEMLPVHTSLGTNVMMLTMAARITQSIFLLARNLMNRRLMGWKMFPDAWKSRLFQTLWWLCWNVLDLLLAVEVTRVYVYKSMSKHSVCCRGQSMNTISIQCHWGCEPETTEQKMVLEEDKQSSLRIETLQEKMDIEADGEQKVFCDIDEDCDQKVSGMVENCHRKVFSDMEIMVTKDTLLATCTNPLILSMVCVPSEDGDSSPSEESSLSESECGDDHTESESESECEDDQPDLHDKSGSEDKDSVKEESSVEETSMDSGMQESWTPKSKDDMDHSDEESDWSDEDDSWDDESDADYSKNDDLWASFCRNDDPYNPLSFSMPTRSPDHKVTEEAFDASNEIQENSAKRCPRVESKDCEKVLNCTKKSFAKKPVLSSFKCSHKCASQKEESTSLEELKEQGKTPVKKVRFSSSVAVHHIVAWNYAYRMARKGPWEEYARDRSRFKKRIAETEAAIGHCLEFRHREKIWAGLFNN